MVDGEDSADEELLELLEAGEEEEGKEDWAAHAVGMEDFDGREGGDRTEEN